MHSTVTLGVDTVVENREKNLLASSALVVVSEEEHLVCSVSLVGIRIDSGILLAGNLIGLAVLEELVVTVVQHLLSIFLCFFPLFLACVKLSMAVT